MTLLPPSDEPVSVPEWDVALEALISEEYRRQGRPLTTEDIQRLAGEHTIRFDDIIDTLRSLVRRGHWCYADPRRGPRSLSGEELDLLDIAERRIQARDLRDFSGGWQPA
ncbi:MAG TPA: hypothetical protein ENJ19_01795 [Gammaproteobacteria bacterium]|nr:hypothetical protein [Gammaproteobacteria bacterium]